MANRDRYIYVGDTYIKGNDKTHVVHSLFQGSTQRRVIDGETISPEEARQYPDFGVWRINPKTGEAIGFGGSQTLRQLKIEKGRWGMRLTSDQFNTFCDSLDLGDSPLAQSLRRSFGSFRPVPLEK